MQGSLAKGGLCFPASFIAYRSGNALTVLTSPGISTPPRNSEGNLGNSYLTPSSPATFVAAAIEINNAGLIVGYSYSPGAPYAPFVYDP